MTDTERNELVEKLDTRFGYPIGSSLGATAVIQEIESLGYEIVKKEEFGKYKVAYVEKQFVAKQAWERMQKILNSPANPSS